MQFEYRFTDWLKWLHLDWLKRSHLTENFSNEKKVNNFCFNQLKTIKLPSKFEVIWKKSAKVIWKKSPLPSLLCYFARNFKATWSSLSLMILFGWHTWRYTCWATPHTQRIAVVTQSQLRHRMSTTQRMIDGVLPAFRVPWGSLNEHLIISTANTVWKIF